MQTDNTLERDGEENVAESGESPEESSEDPAPKENAVTLPVTNYPQRERHRSRMLTYGALGQPIVVDIGVEDLHMCISSCQKTVATLGSTLG